MTWDTATKNQIDTAGMVVKWIRTARAAGYGGDDWLPSEVDIVKSALFERIRAGKEPLDEPPPVAMACPWYAVVEDAGPHSVFEAYRGGDGGYPGKDTFVVMQNPWTIVREAGPQSFVVRDGRRDTSYRFLLWFDPEWTHVSQPRLKGMWFLQNLALRPDGAALLDGGQTEV